MTTDSVRRAELWHARQFADERGIYTWMVYDVGAMSCHWFEDEVAARNFLAAFRNGITHPRDEGVNVEA